MSLNEIIKSRHSIREYSDKDVDLRTMGQIFDICKEAPSSGNIQNWRFILVKDKDMKSKIARLCLDQDWMTKAPVCLIVCYDERNIKLLFSDNYEEFSIQNVAIISTYIMLKAAEIGLGTCWVAIGKKKEISELLKLPDYIVPSIILTLGYPASYNNYKKTKRENLEMMIHFESYGKRKADISIFPLSKHLKKLKESKELKNKIKK